MENPATGKLSLAPITKLGLFYFEPTALEQINPEEQAFRGRLVWHEVERDDKGFMDFMTSVINILESDEVYPHTCERCEYCRQSKACLAGKPGALEKGCTCCLWCTYRFQMKELDGTACSALKDLTFKQVPSCSECGSQMIKKTGRYGDFWSCSKYPECRGTRKI